MLIKIDYREKKLIEEIKKLTTNNYIHIDISCCNLSLGDIVICDNSENEISIIERKTLNDLASSIQDGRYKEQSFRLNNSEIHNHNIYYLLEGDLNKFKTNKYTKNIINNTVLISAITSLSYNKGFSIIRCLDVKESALFLMQMTSKLEKITNYYTCDNSGNTPTYSEVATNCKNIKKNNVTSENINEIMLAQIPYVSISIAKQLMETYNSIYNLTSLLKQDNKLLDNFQISTASGKKRKISKKCVSNLITYLLPN